MLDREVILSAGSKSDQRSLTLARGLRNDGHGYYTQILDTSMTNYRSKILQGSQWNGECILVVAPGPSACKLSKEDYNWLSTHCLVVGVKQSIDLEGLNVNIHVVNNVNLDSSRICDKGLYSYWREKQACLCPAGYDSILINTDLGSFSTNLSFGLADFEKELVTYSGPGIVYELVVPILNILKPRKVLFIGWDLSGGKTKLGGHSYSLRFRDVLAGSLVLLIKCLLDGADALLKLFAKQSLRRRYALAYHGFFDQLKWLAEKYELKIIWVFRKKINAEVDKTIKGSGKMYEWLRSQGINVAVYGDKSCVSDKIPRVYTRDEMTSFIKDDH